MKHLKLFFALFAMLALGVGNAWGEEVTETITMKNFGGLTTGSLIYQTKLGTSDKGTGMVAFAFNPTTGQVRGNQTGIVGASVTTDHKSHNWSLYNSDPMAGVIKAIKVTQTATGTNKFQKKLYVSLGTSSQGEVTAVTNAQEQDAGGTAQEINFTIDPSKGYTYFKLLSNEKFTSGTVAGVVVTVTYETASGGGETPETVTISLDKTELSLQEGENATLTATVTGSTESVTWTSSKIAVATVDNTGKVTAVAAGEATITAAIGDVKATCAVTVTAATTPEEPGTGGEETWTLVTNASDLKAGDEVVIAATESDYALGPQANKNRTAVAITKTGNNITWTTNVQIITLETGNKANTFAFNTGSGYLYAASSSENQLKTQSTLDDNGSWTISIASSGVATIKAQGTYTRNWIRKNSQSDLFSCYGSGQSDVAIYKKVTSSGGSEPETPATELTDAQFAWSAATAEATMGASNTFPTLTNTLPVSVTYESSTPATATIDATSGAITLVAPGTTTISAAFAGGEVSGTKYAAKTVTYTLTVKQLVSCADIYNLADNATFVLNDFVVTYVNGDYTYIKDDDGYGLIFTKDASDYDLKAGDKVASGKFEGKKTTYRTLVEIIPITAYDNLNATPGEVPVPEIMATNPTADNINKYVKFEKVKFTTTKLNSTTKSILGTIEGETDAITFYNQYGADVTFNTSKKYDIVGVVSIYDSKLQVNFISAEEVAEPTLNVKITDADFGKVAINGTRERTLTLNGSLLTNTVSLAIEGEGAEHFKLSSYSVDPTDGNITNAKITITYKPTAEGTHTPTLKITSDDVAEQITLTGQAAQEYTVHFYVNDEEDETLKKTVLSGNTLEELPEATSCDLLNYPTFAGWASAAIDGTADAKPTMLDLSTPITSDCNYYAVFEKGTTSSGSTTSAIMKYTGGTTTNMKDGNNAATVGLDETLFNITSTKTASGNYVGLNKNNDIRLYANKDDGNGNILTISMLDGSSITKITLDIKQEANFVVKANGKSITGADNVFNIDYPSCSIQNTTTGATTQLHLNSVTIEYTTSTTTYEYITSCAVVVPTCEIKYDYADGEGECTTDIVEEGAEYTLCATAPAKAGHTFLNWKDQNGGEYAVGATINSVTEDLTLTAQWQVNSYSVTWISLGDEVLVNNADYNTQPTKPATDPTYTCSIGTKEFVGWSTQEIDGAGVPANLYTDEFPVVTEAITYHAVFASKIEGGGSMSKAVSLTNGETVYLATESGIGVTGANTSTNKDATVSTTQGDWMPFIVVTNGLQYQFKNGDNYITAAATSFKITETPSDFAFENGYIVYNVPSGSDAGDYVLLYNSNSGSFYRFYKKSNIGKENYETFYVYKNPTHTDYTTSCPVLELTEGENTLTDGVTADVNVNRSFEKDKLYTISLPFALDAEQVETIFGAGTILYQFAQLVKENGELVLYFSKPSAIAAATPYLIQPTQDVAAGFTVEDATISTTPNNISFTVGATTITMKPILSATAGEKTNGTTEYWLAADKYLYYSVNTVLSLRALFNISTVSGMPPRCRVAFGENVETGVDNITNGENTTIKVIENGQLIIIRNGEKFNAQGIKL